MEGIAPALTVETKRLTRPEWEAARAAYRARVEPWARDRLDRMSRRRKHPVYDFLFEYYSFRPSHLLRWSPGVHVLLEDAKGSEREWADFEEREGGLMLRAAAFPAHRQAYLQWALAFLEATLAREPMFGCFGIHEWAMVYRDPNVRHPQVPLRLSRGEVDAVVDGQPPRCTHYDAFRFFTAAAAPLNRIPLTRETTVEHDQPGCIHANMDLYRFAYKLAPFCPSELLAEAFSLAVAAREIDMRASPYDLRNYGFEPIRIETREGREEYVEHQRVLAGRAAPIRASLLNAYRDILHAVSD